MGITAAVAGVGGAVAGGLGSIFGANKAAKAQTDAANKAIAYLQQNFQLTQGNLAPWLTAGTGAVNQLVDLTGAGPGGNPLTAPLTAPFNPTIEQLSATPGYKFALDQGLKGVQNSAAAKGLGASGPALSGAADYATGLAGTTYQQQFGNYLAGNQQIYNMLSGLSGVGATAATNLGQIGAGAATGSANAAIGAGNAQAAAANTTGQALGNIFGNILGTPATYAYGNAVGNMFNNMPGSGGNTGLFGSSGGGGNSNVGAPNLNSALFPQINQLLQLAGIYGGNSGGASGGPY
jgi:hypothetical protein